MLKSVNAVLCRPCYYQFKTNLTKYIIITVHNYYINTKTNIYIQYIANTSNFVLVAYIYHIYQRYNKIKLFYNYKRTKSGKDVA